jgi:hypothetical protein
MGATHEQTVAFIKEWSTKGAEVARNNNLPVSAMLACACEESGFGVVSKIFSHTHNPFNLQKWPHIRYPTTNQIFWVETKVREDPTKILRAPFNCATDVPDAVRQWCEWILHYGDADGPPGNQNPKIAQVANKSAIERRQKLLATRDRPADFAFNLPLVGFGENATEKLRVKSGNRYRDCWTQYSLTDYD